LFELLEGDEFVASIREGLINPAAYLNVHKLVAFVMMYPEGYYLCFGAPSSKEYDIHELVCKGNDLAS
jgi:hypothetical protein